jgi:DNA-binding transcriptional LysR family regulator
MKADTATGLLPRILSTYQNEDAALAVELVLGGRGEQAQALRERLAEVGLLRTPFNDRDLDFDPLLTEPPVVALASTDPLAHRLSLRLAELGRVSKSAPVASGDQVRASRAEEGADPAFGRRPTTTPRGACLGVAQ